MRAGSSLFQAWPSWTSAGALIDASRSKKRQLLVNGKAVSKPGLQVRRYIGQHGDGSYIYTASADPRDTQVWSSTEHGEHSLLSPTEGVYDAAIGGTSTIIYGTSLKREPHFNVLEIRTATVKCRATLACHAEAIPNSPAPLFHRTKIKKNPLRSVSSSRV